MKHRIFLGIILLIATIIVGCTGDGATPTPVSQPDTATPTDETDTPSQNATATTEADATPNGVLGTLTEGFGGLKDLVNVVVGEPPEVTAKFLPDDTLVYFTMNREPGAGQLALARSIRDIFEGTSDYAAERDELAGNIEDETGIDVLTEIYDWIGSDLTFALLNVGEDLSTSSCCLVNWVTLIQTKDRTASENFLKDLVRYLEDVGSLRFEEVPLLVDGIAFIEEDESISFGLTSSYVLMANSSTVINDIALDIDSPPSDSLSQNADFQTVAAQLPPERFLLGYARSQDIYEDSKRAADLSLQDTEDWLVARRYIPDFTGFSATFIDVGFRFDLYTDTPEGVTVNAANNPLDTARMLPEDTLFMASSTGFQEVWDYARSRLEDIGGLSSVAAGLDRALDELENATGVDAESDIVQELLGEVALAVLPSQFNFDEDGDFSSGAIEILGLGEIGDSTGTKLALRELVDRLNDEEGIPSQGELVGPYKATVLDLSQEEVEAREFSPGYLFTDELLIVGSTLGVLFTAVDTINGAQPALISNPQFLEMAALAPVNSSYIVYADLAGLTNNVVDSLPPDANANYEEHVRPFVEPFESFFVAATSNDNFTLLTMALTFVDSP